MGGTGCAGQSGVKGGKWDNCNSIINKIYLKKDFWSNLPASSATVEIVVVVIFFICISTVRGRNWRASTVFGVFWNGGNVPWN